MGGSLFCRPFLLKIKHSWFHQAKPFKQVYILIAGKKDSFWLKFKQAAYFMLQYYINLQKEYRIYL